MIEQYDDKTIRCPRVGGDVNFMYCRSENKMFPCGWIVGCWQERMDINKFLEDHYSNKERDRIFAPPRPKVESLVNLIEQAKKRTKEKT